MSSPLRVPVSRNRHSSFWQTRSPPTRGSCAPEARLVFCVFTSRKFCDHPTGTPGEFVLWDEAEMTREEWCKRNFLSNSKPPIRHSCGNIILDWKKNLHYAEHFPSLYTIRQTIRQSAHGVTYALGVWVLSFVFQVWVMVSMFIVIYVQQQRTPPGHGTAFDTIFLAQRITWASRKHKRHTPPHSCGPPSPPWCMMPSSCCALASPCAAASPYSRLASARSCGPPSPSRCM